MTFVNLESIKSTSIKESGNIIIRSILELSLKVISVIHNEKFLDILLNDESVELKKLLDEMGNYLRESIHIFLEVLFDKLNIYERIIKIVDKVNLSHSLQPHL